MRKIFRLTFLTFIIAIFALSAAIVGAKIQMYTATGEDYANEVESQDIAKLRARDKAIKNATKQAGVYLKTYSHSVNSELTDDEVTAITSNAWQLVSEPKYSSKIVKGSDETSIIIWTATVEVNVDDSEIQSWIKRDDKDKSTIITQTREAQKASEENERKIEDLREKYNRTKSATEKRRLRKQMNEADREFLANQKIKDGNKLAYAGDYDGAIKFYTESIKLNPNDFWSYQNRGTGYRNLKKYSLGLKDLNKAIEINPNHSYPYVNRGLLYFKTNNYNKAVEDFSKAIELNPNFAEAYFARSLAYLALGENDKAVADSNKANSLKSGAVVKDFDAANYLLSSVTNFMNGEYQQAIDDINKAEKVIPIKDANIFFMRGTAYLQLKQYERAIQDLDKAIELKPSYVEAYFNRGFAYASLGNVDNAIVDATKTIQFNPKFANAYQLRGLCYKELGDEAKAQADFAKAKELGYNG